MKVLLQFVLVMIIILPPLYNAFAASRYLDLIETAVMTEQEFSAVRDGLVYHVGLLAGQGLVVISIIIYAIGVLVL